jgi:alpha-D-ribose 1-methylphosphonate 5-triphosphate synthase subunit PhnI
MAVIDHELENSGKHPAQNEEFVLMHGDSLEMNGFIISPEAPALRHLPVKA